MLTFTKIKKVFKFFKNEQNVPKVEYLHFSVIMSKAKNLILNILDSSPRSRMTIFKTFGTFCLFF